MGNVNASEDSRRYRDGYPGKEDNPNIKVNLEFYSNKRASKPEGDTIEGIHQKWFGNYSLLEAHHGYIQWLFPIREDGLNHYAEQLQLHEAKAIADDPVLQNRVIKSYELMLDFYGMKLADRETGKIERDPSGWRSRYNHLNRSFHNYLRITRILKCLGEVGLERFKFHFVMHVLKEIFENKELTNCKESCIKYWATVLRNDEERKELFEYIEKYEPPSQSSSGRPGSKFLTSSGNEIKSNKYSDSDSDQDYFNAVPKRNLKHEDTNYSSDEESGEETEEDEIKKPTSTSTSKDEQKSKEEEPKETKESNEKQSSSSTTTPSDPQESKEQKEESHPTSASSKEKEL